MRLEAFSNGNSILHKLDPRVKILAYLPLITLTALSTELRQASLSFAAGTITIYLAKVYGRLLVQRLAVVNVFMVFLWLTLPLSIPGETVWTAGSLRISREGLALSLLITIKTNAIALYTVSLLGTTTITALSHALQLLRVPGRLVTVFYFFYRYIGVITDEYEKMLRMLQARGFRSTTSIHTVRVYAYFIGMLFVKSYERSERAYSALLMRGFTGGFPLLTHFTFQRRDLVFACFMTSLFLTIMLL